MAGAPILGIVGAAMFEAIQDRNASILGIDKQITNTFRVQCIGIGNFIFKI
jgi:hypothetical protein